MNDTKRAAYLRGDLTHSEYYGLLVELLGEVALRNVLPGNVRTPERWRELLNADKNLNNVSLPLWDEKDAYVRSLARGAGDSLLPITGTFGWSLSDTVCVLKETARRYANTNV